MKRLVFYCCLVAAIFALYSVSAAQYMADIDRVRIAEAFRVGEKLQNRLWPEWDSAPFSMLFIDDDYEFLIRHPKPTDEFASLGYDKLLKSEVFVRPRKMQKDFLATFPAFGRGPVIVVGKAENTSDKTSTRWMFVVLHEHFHQLQYSRPTYFADVNALNLSRGDTTGMWQLNFPFPYSDKNVVAGFRKLSDKLLDVYNTKSQKNLRTKLLDYVEERNLFFAKLDVDDSRYASFQLWQEGIARYTQYRMSLLTAKSLKPSARFRKLKDFRSFRSESDRLLKATLDELKTLDLAHWERTAFYPFGAVEGLVLDKANPKWRQSYLNDKFALEKFYPKQNANQR